MFLNPQTLIENKVIIPPSDINLSEHLQPNGIDIDCNKVFELNFDNPPIIGKTLVSYKPPIRELELTLINRFGIMGWRLVKGNAYTFDSSFEVNLPQGMCGWVIGRSSLNRQGVKVQSAFYDSGFIGTAGATIYCFSDIIIEQNARIAQIVIAEGNNANMYNGQWQNKK